MSEMSNVDLTPEQKARRAYFERYEAENAPAREAHNQIINEFTDKWNDRLTKYQFEWESKRRDLEARYRGEGKSDLAIAKLTAFELSRDYESYIVEKRAALEAESAKAPPLVSFERWLKKELEKTQSPAEQHLIASMLEEQRLNKQNARDGLEGYLRNPPPNRVLTDLSPASDGDNVNYKRGIVTVIRDTGPRLDVMRINDADIEAALKIAAQKFDVEKGLILTGDAAFKLRAAEIAGRLGYRIQNLEPDLLSAWGRGREQGSELSRSQKPSVEAGITGETARERAQPNPEVESSIPADPAIAAAVMAGQIQDVEIGGDGKSVVIPGQRLIDARAAINKMSLAQLRELRKADIRKEDGGLRLDHDIRQELIDLKLLAPDGKLTVGGRDVVLAYDAEILAARSQNRVAYSYTLAQKTSIELNEEVLREKAVEQALEKKEVAQDAREKELSREKAQEHVVAEKSVEQEQEQEKKVEIDMPTPAPAGPGRLSTGRKKSPSLDFGR